MQVDLKSSIYFLKLGSWNELKSFKSYEDHTDRHLAFHVISRERTMISKNTINDVVITNQSQSCAVLAASSRHHQTAGLSDSWMNRSSSGTTGPLAIQIGNRKTNIIGGTLFSPFFSTSHPVQPVWDNVMAYAVPTTAGLDHTDAERNTKPQWEKKEKHWKIMEERKNTHWQTDT